MKKQSHSPCIIGTGLKILVTAFLLLVNLLRPITTSQAPPAKPEACELKPLKAAIVFR
jgi:hypothetical protein